MPGREFGSAGRQQRWGGIYAARSLPVCSDHQDGGAHACPERESIRSFAAHQATMVIFLSTGMLKELSAGADLRGI